MNYLPVDLMIWRSRYVKEKFTKYKFYKFYEIQIEIRRK